MILASRSATTLTHLRQEDAYQPGSREGIWWLPRPDVKDILVFSNSSERPNAGVLALYDASGKRWQQSIELGARGTVRLSLRELLQEAGLGGSYGVIRFEVASNAGTLDSLHFLYDETPGFSALMKMFDHDPAAKLQEHVWGSRREWTTWAPMLALREPDAALAFPEGTRLEPKVFVRNTTRLPQSAKVKFTWRKAGATGIVTLPALRLKAYEARLIDVQALQQSKRIPPDANWALVEISSPTAQPDDLLAIASSYDSSGRFGAQTPFSDQLAEHWVGGEWQVDATHNSLIAVTNAGDKPTLARLTLHYNHGKDHYLIEKTISPGDQMRLDLGQLVRGTVPDKNGTTLPPDLTSGTYDLWEPNVTGSPSLFEGKIIVDKTFGHLAYGCMVCCGVASEVLLADPTLVALYASTGVGVQAYDACDDIWIGEDAHYNTWDTNDHGIATMQPRQVTGTGVGSTNGFAIGTLPRTHRINCTMGYSNPRNNLQVPSVTINSADLEINQVNVTLAGPSDPTGILTATATGSTYQEQIQANGGNPVAVGSYQLSFNRPSIPLDTYYSLTATWNVGKGVTSPTFNLSRPWWVLGTVRHFQYNTPQESSCNGSLQTAYVFNANCQFTQVQLKSDFVSQTETNGTGIPIHSQQYPVLKYDDGRCKSSPNKPPGADSTNSLLKVSSITGQCNHILTGGDAIATQPGPYYANPYLCDDNVELVNNSNQTSYHKHVEDQCPNTAQGCADHHMDNYSSAQGCTGRDVGDLPGTPYWTIDDH
jgi:hypothetical protein